jgi:hypothetical protein
MNAIHTLKQTLFTQWHLMRWIRLAAGLFLAVQAVQLHDAVAGFISAILLFQAFTNTGCCGVSGCAIPPATKKSDTADEVEYEEVNGKKSIH